MHSDGKALVVIDVQNDYFPGGNFPLWNAEGVLEAVLAAMRQAKVRSIPVILVQHVASGPAPFFNRGTPGVETHPSILDAAPEAPVVVKAHADSFHETNLAAVLAQAGAKRLFLCGMMTQNCVTHTALSRFADAYDEVAVLSDCCTTVSEILHKIALNALTTRVRLTTGAEAF